MFEKEAEEYLENFADCANCKERWGVCADLLDEYCLANGCCYATPKEQDIYIAGAEFGYNKSNEWHYPSKGELPKCDEETQLIFYVNCYYKVGGETLIRKRTVLGFYKKSFLNDDVKLFVEKSKGYEEEHLPKDVIAWKEIVLPELKESE